MPGLGGQELYERVKAMSSEMADRVIFIIGDTGNVATKEFLNSVGNSVLSKPFDFRELEQLVVSNIDRSKSGDELLANRVEPGLPSHP